MKKIHEIAKILNKKIEKQTCQKDVLNGNDVIKAMTEVNDD